MKVSREQAQLNRERVVQGAAKLFRERGFEGVGVADLMKNAGLTHGGFYGQFSSKESLIVEACESAIQQLDEEWTEVLDGKPQKPLASIVSMYVSPGHRDNPGAGCAVAALSIDAYRHGTPVRTALTRAIKTFVDRLFSVMPGRTSKIRRRQSIASFAAMVGGIVLARTVTDPSLSDEIIGAVRAQLLELEKGADLG